MIALVLLSFVARRAAVAAGRAAAVLLPVLALCFYGRYAAGVLEAERRVSAQAVAAQIGEEAKKAEALLAAADDPRRRSRWRRRSGTSTSTAGRAGWSAPPARSTRGSSASWSAPTPARLTRSVVVLALLSLALLAFVGLGWAARTGAALVRYRRPTPTSCRR